MSIENLLAKYQVNTCAQTKIDCWMKKYGLFHKEKITDYYKFSEQEKRMIILKTKEISCLFPYNLSDKEYINIVKESLDNLHNIYNYVRKFDDDIQKLFLNLIRSVEKAEKKIEKGLFKKDSEEKSEFCTDTYIQSISHDLIKMLELCTLKKNDSLKEIGALIVNYLKELGFYVPNQIENNIRSEYISTCSSYDEKTDDKSMHAKIYRFHSLPYVIDYYDEYGQVCSRCIEGICTYYRYEV